MGAKAQARGSVGQCDTLDLLDPLAGRRTATDLATPTRVASMTHTLAAAALLAWAAAAGAQPPSEVVLRGQSEQTYKRLVEASRKLAEGKSAEAADAFQRILDEAGDDLVSDSGSEYRPARRVA